MLAREHASDVISAELAHLMVRAELEQCQMQESRDCKFMRICWCLPVHDSYSKKMWVVFASAMCARVEVAAETTGH